MRTRSARLLWSVPLLAALGCGGETDLTAPAGLPNGLAAAQAGTRVIDVSPGTNPVSFGTVQGPFESATPNIQIFTVTNVGTKVTSGLAISITGTGAAAYSIKPGDDGCTGRSLQLSGKNKSCTVKVTFAPAGAGTFTAALAVTVAQPKATVTVNLSGTGAHATSIIIRSTVHGAATNAGFTSTGGLSPATFTLANGGSRSFNPAPGPYTVSETVPAGYALIDVSCTYGPGANANTNMVTATVTIDIDEGGSADCTFTISEIIAVRGKVFNDPDLNGWFSSGDGVRSGVTVRLKDGGTTIDETTTATDGTYSFAPVAAGSYQIEAVPPAGMAITSGNTQPRSVTVGTASVVDQDFAMMTYTIAGLVNKVENGFCGSGNAGYEGATVNLYTMTLPFNNITFVATTTVASNGHFEFLAPLNDAGRQYLVQVTDGTTQFITGFGLTIAKPANGLAWYGCLPTDQALMTLP